MEALDWGTNYRLGGGGFTSAAVSARKRDLDLATTSEERGAHEQVQIEKGDTQSSKEARIGGRKCQDAATRVLVFALSRGRPKNCRGCLLAALSEKGQNSGGEGSEAFKGKLQRQAPLLHDDGDAAAPSTRRVVRSPS